MDIDTKSSEGPQPHDILWFPDGNVVLATDTYLFKVFKGILSMNSSFFRDMFELPHVGGDGPTVGQDGNGGIGTASDLCEGLPLVTMVDDDGEEVAHLLRAIYERNYYNCLDNDTPLDVILALLKLSTKYDFKDIRKDVIVQISDVYPSTLKEFDSFEENETPMFGESQEDCHIPLLTAAFEGNIDVLLPILYFSTTRYTIQGVLDRTASMNTNCFRKLIKGRELVLEQVSELVAELPDHLLKQVPVTCSGRSGKKPCYQTARYSHLSRLINMEFHCSKGRMVVDGCLNSVCANCSSLVAKSIDSKREEIWEKVPLCFDCPGWDVIQEKLEEIVNSC